MHVDKDNDLGSVINAVENASEKELNALADISGQIAKLTEPKSVSAPNENRAGLNDSATYNRNEQEHPPRSVRAHKRASQEAPEKRHIKTNKKPLIDQLKDNKNTLITDDNANATVEGAKPLQNGSEITIKNQINVNTADDTAKSHQNNIKKSNAEEVKKHYKTANRPSSEGTYADRNGQVRDAGGRFQSSSKEAAEKVRESKELHHESDGDDDEKVKSRLAKWLQDLSDPLESDKVDEAGRAVGSTFWRSGKELYDVGKSAITGTTEGIGRIRTLGQANEEGQEAKRGLFSRFRKPRQQNSQDAISRNMARQQEQTIEKQTDAIQEGNEEIVDRLDLLLKAQGEKKGGGLMSSLLGGTALATAAKAIGGWGKGAAVAAGAAALGVLKGAYNKIRRKGKKSGGIADEAAEKNKGKKGKDAKPTKAATAEEKAQKGVGEKGQSKAAEVEKKAGKQAEETTQKKTTKKAAKKAAKKAKRAAAKKVAEEGAEQVTEKSVEKTALKATEKVGVKAAIKGGLKFIPLLGTALAAGWDAADGYSDEDAQKQTYGTQKLTTKQKASYATASVLSLGGLGDIASEYVGKGARWMGLDGVADTVEKYNTSDMAISINNSLDQLTGLFSSDKKDEERAEAKQTDVITAIEKGSKDTTTEVKSGFTTLLDFLKNPVDGLKKLTSGNSTGSSGSPMPDIKALSGEGKRTLDALDDNFKMLEQRDGLPANTLRTLATIESSGNPNAVGPLTKYGQAKGMFQIVDSTAEDLGLRGKDVFDPVKSSDAASRYMKYLLKDNGGDLNKALAAYNWGMGNVQKKGMENMPEETQNYLAKFHAINPNANVPETAAPAIEDIAAITTPGLAVAQPAEASTSQQSETFTENGQKYHKAKLPNDSLDKDSAIGSVAAWGVEQLGGDKLRTAEGMRHQAASDETVPQRAQAAHVAHRQNVKPLPTGDFGRDENGEVYRRAALPSDSLKQDTMYGEVANWVVENLGGDKLRDAQGMRHQAGGAEGSSSFKAAIAARAAAASRPAIGQIGMEDDGTPIVRADMVGRAVNAQPKAPLAQMPAKQMVVTDYSASNVKPPVSLGDKSVSLDDASRKLLTSIDTWLKKIAGHTEDAAKAADKQSPNTPATAQPQTRSSIPLEVKDPLMQQMAQD